MFAAVVTIVEAVVEAGTFRGGDERRAYFCLSGKSELQLLSFEASSTVDSSVEFSQLKPVLILSASG